MATNAKPVYKRILAEIKWRSAAGPQKASVLMQAYLTAWLRRSKSWLSWVFRLGVVIGGGNLFRGAGLAKAGMNRVVGDHMGMLATVMNGLAMRDALHRAYVNARLMSAIPSERRMRQLTAGQRRSACCATTA